MNYSERPRSASPPSASTPPPRRDPSQAIGAEFMPELRERRSHRLAASVLVMLVLAAGAYLAFGSSSNSVVDPVAAAATRSSDAAGYRERMTMSITGGGMNVTAAGAGSFDPPAHTGQFTMAMRFPNTPQLVQALGSDTLRLTELLDGTTVYMKLPPALTGQLSTLGKSWLSLDLSKLGNVPGASSLLNNPSSDPAEMLEYLRAASDSVFAEGRQRIDGVKTTKYHATVDLSRVADSLPSADQAAAQQAISALEQEGAPSAYPVNVWVDSHHLVRRFQMELDMTSASAGGVEMMIQADLSHYGPQRAPAIPPSSDVAPLS